MTQVTTVAAESQQAPPFYLPQGREVELFEYAWHNRLPVLLKGPTGCGKTRIVQYMAHRLGLPLFTVACHDDLSASDLVGRHLVGQNETYWQDGPLTRAVRQGGICYLDEIIEARKDTTVVIHPLTDDRRILPLERTGEELQAPDSFMLVVSYNPGYQNLMKGLKPSTRQRFVSLRFDYLPREQEIEVVVRESGIDSARAAQLVALAHALRQIRDVDLEEGASTRLLVDSARLMQHGFDAIEACRAALVEPLSDEPATLEALMQVVEATFGG